ncbi:MAG: hypothetical protein AAF580_06565 [Pseudomonadota bacterium]
MTAMRSRVRRRAALSAACTLLAGPQFIPNDADTPGAVPYLYMGWW